MSSLLNYGVSLTGGGARGSYQAGVLKGISEILKSLGLIGNQNPFQIWSGVSAGSINAMACASGIDQFDYTVNKLVSLWSSIRPEDVYLTDIKSLSLNSARWITDLTLGSILEKKQAKSLLDTSPLWTYLGEHLQLSRIDRLLREGKLKAAACSAFSFSDNCTVTFLQSQEPLSWNRHKRISKNVEINIEHIIASCAIPILFPSVKIGEKYFSDGSFRSLSPISPLIHMGANKILVIGVRGKDEFSEKRSSVEPSIAKMAGAILNSLFFDSLEIDLERIRHINELLQATQKQLKTERSDYSLVDYQVIRPSRDVTRMAADRAKSFPRMIRFLLGGLGPLEESAELASYILFISDFTRDLIDLGYSDAMKQKNAIEKWLTDDASGVETN